MSPVRTERLLWTDIDGRIRSVVTESAGVRDLVFGLRIDPEDLGWGGIAERVRLEPEEGTFRSPWSEDETLRFCRLVHEGGDPSPVCSRSVLARALDRAESAGFAVIAAAELECFLLDPETGEPVYSNIDNYSITSGYRFENVMAEVRGFGAAGVPVIGTNTEYGCGQFEINLRHDSAMDAADAAVLLRNWTGAVAARSGFAASFASKIGPEHSGNGLHYHQSLWQGDSNAFWREDGFSELGRSYLSGMLSRIAEMALLGSPTALSYTRRADGSFCPTSACWGGDNRTVALRVLDEDEKGARIEQRDSAADANPHLVLATQVQAGLDGIEKPSSLPEPVSGNAYSRLDLHPLPRTIADALPLFEKSELAVRVLGEEAHASLCAIAAERVDRFLAGFPGDPDPDGGW